MEDVVSDIGELKVHGSRSPSLPDPKGGVQIESIDLEEMQSGTTTAETVLGIWDS